MAFGVTSSGFSRKTTQDVQDELEADLRGEFGSDVRLARTSVFGQLVAVLSAGFGAMHELAEAVFWVNSVARAEGAWLDNLASIRNVQRQAATPTRLDAAAGGTGGTVIPAGSVVELDATATRFVTVAEATLDGAGTATLELEAEEAGPIEVNAGESWTIITTITGWDTVTNAAAGTTGRNVETDQELRSRLLTSRGSSGSATVEALVARLRNVDGVTSVQIIENDGETDDSDGRPPGSFEALVSGGSDDAVAEQIWTHKPASIKPYSTAPSAPARVEVTITDSQDVERLIVFTRPQTVEIWIRLTLTTARALSPAEEAALKAEVVAYGDTLGVGQDVVSWRVAASADVLADVPITDVAVEIEDVNPPTATGNYTIGDGELADLDDARILLVEV